MTQKCALCEFYRVDAKNLTQGFCHINPPQAFLLAGQNGQLITNGSWPPVKEDAWCGKFSPKVKQ